MSDYVKRGASYAGQVAKDTAIGVGKEAYNTYASINNMVNDITDFAISPFTDFRFGHAPMAEASTPGERGAMLGTAIVTFAFGAGELKAAASAARAGEAGYVGISSLPRLRAPASGNNGELFGQIMKHLQSFKGTGAEKAAFTQQLADQANSLEKGFEMTKVATTDGNFLFAGRGGEILVITKAGDLLRGTNKAVTYVIENGQAMAKVAYEQLYQPKPRP
jgi:hypothetical protein